MNTLIVTYSVYGNTRQVAEAIGGTLEQAGSVRLVPMEELRASDLEGVDLLVMGSPTHRMNLPEVVRPVFETLPKGILHGAPAAAFDTSYRMSAFLARMTAAKKLAQRLRKLGGKLVVPPETFHVVEREGPLYEGEIERAQAWAAGILEQVTASRIRSR